MCSSGGRWASYSSQGTFRWVDHNTAFMARWAMSTGGGLVAWKLLAGWGVWLRGVDRLTDQTSADAQKCVVEKPLHLPLPLLFSVSGVWSAEEHHDFASSASSCIFHVQGGGGPSESRWPSGCEMALSFSNLAGRVWRQHRSPSAARGPLASVRWRRKHEPSPALQEARVEFALESRGLSSPIFQ